MCLSAVFLAHNFHCSLFGFWFNYRECHKYMWKSNDNKKSTFAKLKSARKRQRSAQAWLKLNEKNHNFTLNWFNVERRGTALNLGFSIFSCNSTENCFLLFVHTSFIAARELYIWLTLFHFQSPPFVSSKHSMSRLYVSRNKLPLLAKPQPVSDVI